MYFSDPIWDAIDHHLVEIEGVTKKDVVEDLRSGENLGPDLGKLKFKKNTDNDIRYWSHWLQSTVEKKFRKNPDQKTREIKY